MKKILIPFVLLLLTFCSCTTGHTQNSVNINVTPSNLPGFNVPNFAQLLKSVKDPQSLEQAINSPNNNINNLDLNNDGQVDYLKVVETQPGTFQVVDDTSPTQSTIVATLNINQQNNTVNVYGNQSYCGNYYNYTSHFTLGDYLLLSYILRPHPYYVPMYHYGYYPSYYHRTVIRRTYVNSRPGRYATPTNVPNRTSLSNPTTSQRSFSTRNTSQPVRTGGFGNRSGSSFGHSSGRSGFGSSGGHSFGGGRHR
jgi:hypothetical protein